VGAVSAGSSMVRWKGVDPQEDYTPWVVMIGLADTLAGKEVRPWHQRRYRS